MQKSKVLVVDDEELYRRAIERILTRVGHDVVMARNAAEALEQVSSISVDLVLCDIQMPGINGLELIRQIRDIEPELPCIVMTGYNTPENSIEALQAGAFWYLEKPFEGETLGVVRRLLELAVRPYMALGAYVRLETARGCAVERQPFPQAVIEAFPVEGRRQPLDHPWPIPPLRPR